MQPPQDAGTHPSYTFWDVRRTTPHSRQRHKARDVRIGLSYSLSASENEGTRWKGHLLPRGQPFSILPVIALAVGIGSLASIHVWAHTQWQKVSLKNSNAQGTLPGEETNSTDWPKAIWLMSFPNSGTSFTLHLTRESTLTTTATNYALEGDFRDRPSEPLREDEPNGPFHALLKQGKRSKPTRYALTKTHCGGYCSDCLEFLYSTRSFRYSCHSGNKAVLDSEGNLKSIPSTYSPRVVAKAVHLFRNPLDNVVARFHLEYNRFKGLNRTGWIEKHPNNREGFHRWCEDVDRQVVILKKYWIDVDLVKALSGVPCKAEFFRYVQWHNLAYTTREEMGLPSMVLYYHDYAAEKFNYTLKKLLDFVELPLVGHPTDFYAGKEYFDLYTQADRKRIRAFIEEFASPQVWDILRTFDYHLEGHDQRESLEQEVEPG